MKVQQTWPALANEVVTRTITMIYPLACPWMANQFRVHGGLVSVGKDRESVILSSCCLLAKS
jgi:hypothetical protein